MRKPNPIGTQIEVKFLMRKTYFHAPSCAYTTIVLWLPTPCEPFTATVSGFVKRYEGFITTYPNDPAEWTSTSSLSLVAVRRSPFAAEIVTPYTPKILFSRLELVQKENPSAP